MTNMLNQPTVLPRLNKTEFLSIPAPISHGRDNSLPSIGIGPRERHCPSCESIVYSRRQRLCGVCGQVLPADCLFTATASENVEMLLRTDRHRHRAWLKRMTAV